MPEKKSDLFVWKSPSRSVKNYSGTIFAVIGLIALATTIVLILFDEWLAILVTWATYFLFFALTKAPVETMEHRITAQGIVSMNHTYLWQDLGPFWFTIHRAEIILHVASWNL